MRVFFKFIGCNKVKNEKKCMEQLVTIIVQNCQKLTDYIIKCGH